MLHHGLDQAHDGAVLTLDALLAEVDVGEASRSQERPSTSCCRRCLSISRADSSSAATLTPPPPPPLPDVLPESADDVVVGIGDNQSDSDENIDSDSAAAVPLTTARTDEERMAAAIALANEAEQA